MVFGNGVKSIEAAAYNGVRTVVIILPSLHMFEKNSNFHIFLSGTEFACAEAGKTEGCTITDGKKTCYCTGATCNKYTQANFYDPIKCNVKDEVPKVTSDVDGNALLVATDCDEGITMCMNMTVMDSEKMRTGRRQFQLPDP